MYVRMRYVCMFVCITMHALGEAQSSTPPRFSELPPSSGKQSLQLCLVPSRKKRNGIEGGGQAMGEGGGGHKWQKRGIWTIPTKYNLQAATQQNTPCTLKSGGTHSHPPASRHSP